MMLWTLVSSLRACLRLRIMRTFVLGQESSRHQLPGLYALKMLLKEVSLSEQADLDKQMLMM